MRGEPVRADSKPPREFPFQRKRAPSQAGAHNAASKNALSLRPRKHAILLPCQSHIRRTAMTCTPSLYDLAAPTVQPSGRTGAQHTALKTKAVRHACIWKCCPNESLR